MTRIAVALFPVFLVKPGRLASEPDRDDLERQEELADPSAAIQKMFASFPPA